MIKCIKIDTSEQNALGKAMPYRYVDIEDEDDIDYYDALYEYDQCGDR